MGEAKFTLDKRVTFSDFLFPTTPTAPSSLPSPPPPPGTVKYDVGDVKGSVYVLEPTPLCCSAELAMRGHPALPG